MPLWTPCGLSLWILSWTTTKFWHSSTVNVSPCQTRLDPLKKLKPDYQNETSSSIAVTLRKLKPIHLLFLHTSLHAGFPGKPFVFQNETNSSYSEETKWFTFIHLLFLHTGFPAVWGGRLSCGLPSYRQSLWYGVYRLQRSGLATLCWLLAGEETR